MRNFSTCNSQIVVNQSYILEIKDLHEARNFFFNVMSFFFNVMYDQKRSFVDFFCTWKLEFVKIKVFQRTFVEIKEIQGDL